MASSRLLAREVREEPRRAADSANPDRSPQKHSVLIVVGRTEAEPGRTGHISADIERGIRSWDVDWKSCNLNLHLQEFFSHHTASFKAAGQKSLRHSTKVLDTQVLISPSQEQVLSEVFALLSFESAHKLLILAGQTAEDSGGLLFHRGLFSPNQLKQIITEQFLDEDPSASAKFSLTLSCPNIGQWKETLLGNRPVQGPFTLHINPPEVLPAMAALGEFSSLISSTLCPPSPFELLPPPSTVGFLKLSRPCCYVFPAGRGDCAFFAVNGFTMLVDGGSDAQACFWKLVRHLDRVDAVLLTHIGTENLTGVNTFLERKVAELELGSDVKEDPSKRLISPELGVVFFNAPIRLHVEQHPCVDNVLKSTHQASVTVNLLKKLDIRPQPMFRTQAAPIEPITLFQKMGVGQLDLYILSPSKSSQEYQTFMQNWPDGSLSASKCQTLPLTALSSVCALLVWHPACLQEKVVRVLFPGVTPQAKLLQGLEKLKTLAFLQKPTVTTGDLEKLSEDKNTKGIERQDSGKSAGKEALAKQSKDGKGGKLVNGVDSREVDKTKNKETPGKQKVTLTEKGTLKKGGKDGKKDSGMKNDLGKKEILPSKPKNENKTKVIKEAKNDSKTGARKTRKPSGKEASEGKKVHLKSESPDNNATKSNNRTQLEIPEPPDAEQQNQSKEKKSEGEPCGSKTSTPEDMMADFLQLRDETEREETQAQTAGAANRTSGETANDISAENKQTCDKVADRPVGDTVSGAGVAAAGGGDNGLQESFGNAKVSEGAVTKSVKVVGFPLALNKGSNDECAVEFDLTPTEYTLLDGALKNSPPSRSSPENQPPISPDEETVGPSSPNSRPNSAGHTPYCLSPDDVWCNKATLSRLQAQMGNIEPTDVAKQCEGQAKSAPESHTNPKEKHLSFLSLGPLKDGASDPSPSVATTTTTTTHSMPAEVSSPQSTEVDESLSMSFEQGPTAGGQREGEDPVHPSHSNGGHFVGMSLPVKKTLRSLSSEMGRPPAPSALQFEASAHDVDLCLVSPCEYKHFKLPDSSSGASEPNRGVFGLQQHGNNNNNVKDVSPSDSNAPVCTEDCPSTTADGVLDSDEDESCSEPSNSPHDTHSRQTLPADPPPAPLRDSPPPPPHPDASMPVPQSDSEANGRRVKSTGMRGKKTSGATEGPQRSGSGKNKTGGQSGVAKGKKGAAASLCTPSTSTCLTPAKSSTSSGSKSNSADEVSVFVDLAYIPSGASSATVNVDFFKSVRSSCYIISGDSVEREELVKHTLDALLEGKLSWLDPMQVTVIPTYESASMQDWYQQTLERQKELGIIVLGSNSTVAMQDETFPACKIEF